MTLPNDKVETWSPTEQPEAATALPEAAPEPTEDALEDALRRLRWRRLQSEAWSGAAEPTLPAPGAWPAAGVADEETEVEAEAEFDFSAAFAELQGELRRVGRELFKTNRAAEGQQETFNAALAEIQQLAAVVAQIPAQSAAAVGDARFEAKAALCRDLLRLGDRVEASLSAADELIARLQPQAEPPPTGLAFRFAAARRMRDSLTEAVTALRQWRAGQALLVERVQAILLAAGARPMETSGRLFDPTLHRAVATEARPDLAPGTIAGEELRGYTLEGRILRYAEVIVAKDE